MYSRPNRVNPCVICSIAAWFNRKFALQKTRPVTLLQQQPCATLLTLNGCRTRFSMSATNFTCQCKPTRKPAKPYALEKVRENDQVGNHATSSHYRNANFAADIRCMLIQHHQYLRRPLSGRKSSNSAAPEKSTRGIIRIRDETPIFTLCCTAACQHAERSWRKPLDSWHADARSGLPACVASAYTAKA